MFLVHLKKIHLGVLIYWHCTRVTWCANKWTGSFFGLSHINFLTKRGCFHSWWTDDFLFESFGFPVHPYTALSSSQLDNATEFPSIDCPFSCGFFLFFCLTVVISQWTIIIVMCNGMGNIACVLPTENACAMVTAGSQWVLPLIRRWLTKQRSASIRVRNLKF